MVKIKEVAERMEGGQASLARLLDVSPQAVSQWVRGKRPIPPRRVLDIERVTGISRHELRPDVFGEAV